jgi:signal transduction histidine kinase
MDAGSIKSGAAMANSDDKRIRILLVDDERVQLRALAEVLETDGFAVTAFSDPAEALESLAQNKYELMLCDLVMPDLDGIALTEAALHIAPAMGCVLITGRATVPSAVDAMRAGALDFVLKPFDANALKATLQRALAMRQLRLEKHAAEQSLRASLDQLNQTNRDLLEAQLKVRQASEAKSRFIAGMSHELRTPLNSIVGFAHILNSAKLVTSPAQRVQFSGHILNSAKHLLTLINEILDLAKIESATQELRLEAVQLAALLDECRNMVEPMCQAREIGTEFAVDGTVVVQADRLRLKQVLLNLLTNGIKYNRRGGILQVAVACSGSMVRISVSDAGLGIPAEKLCRLFRPFDRLGLDGSAEAGTGLGLVISKHLVEQMGGETGVASQPGQGSTFWLQLPLAILA